MPQPAPSGSPRALRSARRILRWAIAPLLLLVALLPAFGWAAGTVQELRGTATITAKGERRPASIGSRVLSGDTLETAAQSYALVVMDDGGSLSVRDGTTLQITSFSREKGNENILLALFSGAVRAITGSIGQLNQDRYRITTTSATIGIRGTDFEALVVPDGPTNAVGISPGTYTSVYQGATFIEHRNGDRVEVPPGHAGFFAHRSDARPRLLRDVPAFLRRHTRIDREFAPRLRALHGKRFFENTPEQRRDNARRVRQFFERHREQAPRWLQPDTVPPASPAGTGSPPGTPGNQPLRDRPRERPQ